MSKTDKTQPTWVKNYFDGSIDHDHAMGRCIEQTYEDAKAEKYERAWRWSHDCGRRVKCKNPDYDPSIKHWNNSEFHYYTDWNLECGHCDNHVTCDRQINGSWRYQLSKVYGDRVPAEVCNLYERQYRQNERVSLKNAAREYNYYGETDLEPEENRHRHKASWYYW